MTESEKNFSDLEIGEHLHSDDDNLSEELREKIEELDTGEGVIYSGKRKLIPVDTEPDNEPSMYEPLVGSKMPISDNIRDAMKNVTIQDIDDDMYDPVREAEEYSKREYQEAIDDSKNNDFTVKDLARAHKVMRLPMPPHPSKRKPIDELYEKWRAVFMDLSWNNEVASRILFHVVLGAYIKNSRFMKGSHSIDPRVNFQWIQSSGSGKTSARKMVANVANDLDLVYKEISEFSDAGLIGGFDYQSQTQTHEPKYGFLKTADIIYADDANEFIADKNVAKHSMKTRKHIRDALNAIGNNRVSRDLKPGEISFYPEASIVATSYWFPGNVAVADKSGFYQRFVIFPRELSEEDRKENEKQEKKRAVTDPKSYALIKKRREEMYTDLIESFQNIDNSSQLFIHTQEAIEKIFDIAADTREYIQHLGQVKQFTTEFLDRTRNYIYILSLHSAAVRNDTEINVEDVNYAIRTIIPLFQEAVSWFEGNRRESRTDEEKLENVVRRVVKKIFKEEAKNNMIQKSKLIDLIAKRERKSPNTIRYNWLPHVENEFEVEVKTNGKAKKVFWKKV